jgi:hypothetical protein
MRPTTRARCLSLATLCAGLLLAGCTTTTTMGSQSSGKAAAKGPWLEPSPQLEQKIDQESQRLPWTHGLERVELIQWFAGVGEPAYPRLLGMVSDPRTDVAGSALAALGATRDARLVQPLHDIPWPKSHENGDLRLERARTLLRLGDWSVLPIMVEGLRDDRLMTRALCAQALSEATHEKLGYDARAEPEEREAAIGRWQTWLRERGHDKLLIP